MPKNYVYQRAEDLGLPIMDSTSPVLVTVTHNDVINAKKMVRFSLPPSVQKEIVSFDRAQMFASGVYQLSAISPADTPARAKRHRAKKKREEVARAKRLRESVAAQRREIAAKIERVAAATKADVTPDFVEFNERVAGILSASAPTPLTSERHYHRSQYVRTLVEPK